MNSSELSSAKRDADSLNISPLEILLQVALPLIPILAIAVVTLGAIQRSDVEKLKGGLEDYDAGSIHELVIQLERQRLIARYELLLRSKENELALGAFPFADNSMKGNKDALAPRGSSLAEPAGLVQFPLDDEGFPTDARFAQLCQATQTIFRDRKTDNLDGLALELYIDALKLKGIDKQGDMYDAKYYPSPAGADEKTTTIVGEGNRTYALTNIKAKLMKYLADVQEVQFFAVQSLQLKRGEAFEAIEEREVYQNILGAFRDKGLPLYPYLIEY